MPEMSANWLGRGGGGGAGLPRVLKCLGLGTIDVVGWRILTEGAASLGLNTLHAVVCPPQFCTLKMSPDVAKCPPKGSELLPVGNPVLVMVLIDH